MPCVHLQVLPLPFHYALCSLASIATPLLLSLVFTCMYCHSPFTIAIDIDHIHAILASSSQVKIILEMFLILNQYMGSHHHHHCILQTVYRRSRKEATASSKGASGTLYTHTDTKATLLYYIACLMSMVC